MGQVNWALVCYATARVSYTLKKRVTYIVCNLESDLKGIRNYRKSFQITNMITIKVLTSDECKNMLSK